MFIDVVFRNVKFECNFGKKKDGTELAPLKEALEGYTQVGICSREIRCRDSSLFMWMYFNHPTSAVYICLKNQYPSNFKYYFPPEVRFLGVSSLNWEENLL